MKLRFFKSFILDPKTFMPKWVSLVILIFFIWNIGLPNKALQALPIVQRAVLPNQLILLTSMEHSLPFVTLQLLIGSGSTKDPMGAEGLSQITAKALLLGTLKRSVTAIHEELDFMGASLSSSSGRDYATLTLKILKKDLEKGMDLFMEVLTQPIFPEEEIRREIERTLASIQSEEDQPEEVAEKAFQRTLFLNHPYRHPVVGTKESLPHLTREKILQFYHSYYHPNNSILIVVGDISGEEIKTMLLPRLTNWPMGKVPQKPVSINFEEEQRTIKIHRPITQANIIIGHRGVSRDNPDYYALSVMNYILGGGGFASRLMEEIRNKRGLAYSVTSYFDPGKYPGSFQISLQTKNASAREAITLSFQEMKRIQKEFISEKELEGAKKYLIGSFPMRIDTQGKLANFLAQVEYYRLGLDYPNRYPTLIRSVTREEILRVAQKYLFPEKSILVIVANLKETKLE